MGENVEDLIYIPRGELHRLMAQAAKTSSLGWWLSGFACGFAAALITGWAA